MFIASLLFIVKSLLISLYVLLMVAFYTILERKIMANMQRRKGPNLVGPFGLLQAIADGLKLLMKATVYPQSAASTLFTISPFITFCLSYVSWALIPFSAKEVFVSLPLSILYFLAFSGLSLYGIILAGWASNSKYSLLGAIRSIAQMVSYEVSLGVLLLSVVATAGTLNITGIVIAQTTVWYVLPHFPIFVFFFISALAETNRHPFDFAEAESELVSGYNTEYGSLFFVLFFLAEYANMILMSTMTVLLFFGGWGSFGYLDFLPQSLVLGGKTLVFMALFVTIRASYPRMRYDQLMEFCWKNTLPFSLAWFILTLFVTKIFNLAPPVGGPLLSFPEFYNYYKASDYADSLLLDYEQVEAVKDVNLDLELGRLSNMIKHLIKWNKDLWAGFISHTGSAEDLAKIISRDVTQHDTSHLMYKIIK